MLRTTYFIVSPVVRLGFLLNVRTPLRYFRIKHRSVGGVMNIGFSIKTWAPLLFLAFGLLPHSLFGQTGRITGQVLDASQAAVPDAKVTLDNPANGDHRQIQTDNVGRYTFADLPIGRYTVRAEKTGFQTQVRHSVEINVGATVPVDFALPTGQISE